MFFAPELSVGVIGSNFKWKAQLAKYRLRLVGHVPNPLTVSWSAVRRQRHRSRLCARIPASGLQQRGEVDRVREALGSPLLGSLTSEANSRHSAITWP